MPTVDVTVECPVFDSFRVQKVAGMFDVPMASKLTQRFCVEVPAADEPWMIGAIVGPSGSGKSTVARKAFGEDLYESQKWARDKSILDCLGDGSVKDITHVLTAVGFSSPPSWVKPYHVLSNGEKFRVDLARALLSGRKLIAFDEFSSVVGRTVAKVGSAAIAKSLRKGRIGGKFVAITCHYDVIEWLEPDWVLDMATGTLARGLVQRPQIRLEVFQCERSAWKLFAQHHYLSRTLHGAAQCFLATWNDEPVGFCAIQPNMGHKGCWRICRVVVLPDYQGLGIGTRLMEAVADIWHNDRKMRVTITSTHPSVIRHNERSPLWRLMRVNKTGNGFHTLKDRAKLGWDKTAGRPVTSAGRAVVAFEYVGWPAGSLRREAQSAGFQPDRRAG